ncbi:autotransporter-associated beta strand repeat-containing protein [Fimbriiglobus ruber]|nr:autotransporter-associated beta strand repeat-containing protein [Fimbriiglobus ruber]
MTPTAYTITTIAGNGTHGYNGDGGPATAAELANPLGTAVDAAGDVFIADQANARVREVSPSGVITTIAGNGTPGFSGDGGPATAAELDIPAYVAVDAAGDVFITENANNRVREVNASGTITTIAGNGSAGSSGDGGPATAAELHSAEGVAVDAAGDVFFVEETGNRVREVSASGIITTIAGNGTAGFSGDGGPATAAELHDPFGVAVDAAGNVFIADLGNYSVREVSPSGVITTIAGNGTPGFSDDGGPATAAELHDPFGVAVDAAGDVFIADASNNRVREVSASGVITTVAGNGTAGFSGDGGLAAAAELNNPEGVAVDATGDVFIVDQNNQRVRELLPEHAVVSVDGTGNLIVADSTPDDSLTATLSGSNVQITSATNPITAGSGATQVNPNTVAIPLASIIGNIQVTGSGGNDTLTVDYTGGPLPAVNFVGSTSGSGTLAIKGTFQTVTETVTTTGPGHSGTLSLFDGTNTDTISYSDLAPVDMTGTTAGNLVFNLPAGTQAVLEASGTPGVDDIRNTGGAAFEATTFANPATSLTINAAGGSTVQLAAMDAGFAPATETFTGLATDTYQFTNAGAVPAATGVTLTTADLDLNGLSPTIGALNGTGTILNSGAAGTLTVTGGGSFAGSITGETTALTVGGKSQTLTLSGNNTYSGATTIDATDTLQVGSATALPSGTNVQANGTLDLGGTSPTIGSLNGAATGVVQNGGTLTVTGGGIFSGNVTGATTAVTVGGTAKTLTLAGNDTYSGLTTINAGDTLATGSATGLTAATSVSAAGTLDLNGFNVSIGALNGPATGVVQNSEAVATLTVTGGGIFSGNVTGSNTALTVGGTTQTLTLSGNNTYSGLTTIDASDTLQAGSATALGDTTGATTVLAGGTLDLNGQAVGAEPVTLNGTGVGGAGALINSSATAASLAGDVTDGGSGYSIGGSGNLTLTGAVTGTLTKVGTGTLTLGGTTDNTNLDLLATAGIVVLAKTSSGATVHAVNVGYTVSAGATVQLGGTGGDQIADTASVTVNPGGVFDLNGLSETISTLAGDGTVDDVSAGGTSTLTVGANNGSGSFSGSIQNTTGAASLVKTGTGTFTLSGPNTYTGATTISGGTLDLTGTVTSNVTVQTSATLAGTGTVTGTLTANTGGTVAPSSGVNTPLTVTGGTTLSAGSALAIVITSAAGGNYSQLASGGTITLGAGALLTVDGTGAGLTSATQQSFRIIKNTGAAVISGQFSGYAEGGPVLVTGSAVTPSITYNGGLTNNVDLNTQPSINGTAGNDKFVFRKSTTPGLNEYSVDGGTTFHPISNTLPITFNGGAGADTLTVDYVNGDPGVAVAFNGGGQTGDTLIVKDTTHTRTAVYRVDTSTVPQHAGSATVGATTIAFTGLAPVEITGMLNVTFNTFTAANQHVTIANDTTTPGGPYIALSGYSNAPANTFETLLVRDDTSVTLDTTTPAGDDTVTIAGADGSIGGAVVGNLSIITGTGTDAINITGAVNIPTAVTLNSGGAITEIGGAITTVTLNTTSVTGTMLNGANAVRTFTAANSGAGAVSLTDTANPLTVAGVSQTGTGLVTINDTGAISVTGPVSVGTNGVSLTASAAISQTSAGVITAGLLTTNSGTGTTLSAATNAVTSFNATNSEVGPVSLKDSVPVLSATGITDTLAGGSVTVTNTDGSLSVTGPINAGPNLVILSASTTIGQTAAGIITAGALATSSATGTDLSAAANVVPTFEGMNTGVGVVNFDDAVAALSVAGVADPTAGGSVTVTNTGGSLTVTGAITAGTNPVTLNAATNIAQTAVGVITAGLLTTTAATGIDLSTAANAVAAFNANVTGSGIVTLNDAVPALTITGVADAVAGGSVTVTNTGGSVVVTGHIAASPFPVALSASTTISQTTAGVIAAGLLATNSVAGTDLSAATNAVAIFNATNSGAGVVNFNDSVSTLVVTGITNTAAGGSAVVTNVGGSLTVSGPINVGANPITLNTSANITQSAAGVIMAGLLTTNSVTGADLSTAANAVSSFNATNTETGGVNLDDATPALAVTGIADAAAGGFVLVTNSGGSLAASGPINAGANPVTLNAAANIAQTSTGVITAASLTTNSGAGTNLYTTVNAIATFNAIDTGFGPVFLSDAVPALTITGITGAIGFVSVTNGGGSLTVTGPIAAGATPAILTAATNIGQTAAGVITARALETTSATGTDLSAAVNAVLGFTATNTGVGVVNLNDAVPNLTVTGIANAATGGSVTVTNTGTLLIADPVAAGVNPVALTVGANISQVVTGGITAGLLTTTSVTGTDLGYSVIAINAVTSFNATNTGAGVVNLTDAVPALTVTGIADAVSGGSVSVTNAGGNLTVVGPVGAGGNAVALAAGGLINQAGSGVITAGSLTTTSVAGTDLSADPNAVASFNATNTGVGVVNLNDAVPALTVVQIADATAGGSVAVTNTGTLSQTGSINAGTNSVTLSATSIGQTAFGNGIIAGSLTTTSTTGADLSGFNTVASFNATNTGAGVVNLNDAVTALTVTGVTDATAGGSVRVTNNGTLSFAGPVTAGANPVTLSAGSIDQTAAGVITAGVLTTNSATGIDLGPAANIVASFTASNVGGDVNLTDTAPALTVTGITYAAFGGPVSVSNTGSLSLTGPVAAGVYPVTLSAVSIGQTAAGVITAGLLTTNSVTGTDLSTAANVVTSFNATNTGVGAINLRDAVPALTVTGVTDTTAGGQLVVTNTSGSITVAGAIQTGPNAVTLSAATIINETATAAIATTGLLTTNSGTGTDLSGGNNFASSFTATNTGAGVVNLADDVPSLSVTGVSDATAGGPVTITNSGGITLIGPLNAGANAVTLTAGTIITQTATGIIAAGLLTANSATGTALSSAANAVASFNATNTVGGVVNLSDAVPTLSVTGIADAGAGASVALANTGGGLVLTGPVDAGSNPVTLTASSTITQSAAGVVTAGLLTTTSAGGTGLSDATNAVVALDAINTGAGVVYFQDATPVLYVNGVADATAGGAVSLTNTNGSVNVSGPLDAGANAVGLTASGAIGQTATGVITAGPLYTTSAVGTYLGTATNEVATITATNTGGIVTLTDGVPTLTVAGITQGTGDVVLTNSGALATTGPVTVAAGNVNLFVPGDVTIGGPLSAQTLTQTGGAGATAFDAPVTLTGGGPVADYTTGGALNLATSAAVFNTNVTAAGAVVLQLANGAAQPGGAIDAPRLYLTGAGTFQLDQSGNTLTDTTADLFADLTSGSVAVRSQNDFFVRFEDPTRPAIRIQAGGNVTLTTGGSFTADDPAAHNAATDPTQLQPLFDVGGGTVQVYLGVGLTADQTTTNLFEAEARAAQVVLGRPGPNTPADPLDNISRDTFDVRPMVGANLVVNGNAPASSTLSTPGDALAPILVGIATANLTSQGTGNGTYTFPGTVFHSLVYTSIESLGGVRGEAFAVETGPTATNPVAGYAVRVQFSQLSVGGATTTINTDLVGSGIITNPFVVSPTLQSATAQFGPPKVAMADVNGDGIPDLILGGGPGDAPLVTIIDGRRLTETDAQGNPVPLDLGNLAPTDILAQFFPFEETFRGGVDVTAGDIEQDGRADVVVSAGVGGAPRVEVFRIIPDPTVSPYQRAEVVQNFFPFESTLRSGINVAVGDVNGDGVPDLVFGAGPGGGPRVQVRDGKTGDVIRDFFAYDPNFRGGVYVDVGGYSSDSVDDLVTAPGPGGGPDVQIFPGSTNPAALFAQPIASFFAFNPPAAGTGLIATASSGSTFDDGVGGVAFGGSQDGIGGRRSILVSSPRGAAFQIAEFLPQADITQPPVEADADYEQVLAGSIVNGTIVRATSVAGIPFTLLVGGGSVGGYSSGASS